MAMPDPGIQSMYIASIGEFEIQMVFGVTQGQVNIWWHEY